MKKNFKKTCIFACSLLTFVGAAKTFSNYQQDSSCLVLLEAVESHSDVFDEEYDGLRPGLPPKEEPKVAEVVEPDPNNQGYHTIKCDGVSKTDPRYANAALHCVQADNHKITESCGSTHGESSTCLTGCVVHTVQ